MNQLEEGLNFYFHDIELEKIRSCRIGIAGAGGLGSNIAALLVRCGFIWFTLMDFDQVEASNLNRQYFLPVDIGMLKVEALRRQMLALNPALKIEIIPARWSPGNTSDFNPDLFLSCNILFEAFDMPETKAVFVDYYQDKVPYVISGNGLAGINGPDIRIRRFQNIFFVGDGVTETEASAPPLAPRVTACAALMADTALGLVLGR